METRDTIEYRYELQRLVSVLLLAWPYAYQFLDSRLAQVAMHRRIFHPRGPSTHYALPVELWDFALYLIQRPFFYGTHIPPDLVPIPHSTDIFRHIRGAYLILPEGAAQAPYYNLISPNTRHLPEAAAPVDSPAHASRDELLGIPPDSRRLGRTPAFGRSSPLRRSSGQLGTHGSGRGRPQPVGWHP